MKKVISKITFVLAVAALALSQVVNAAPMSSLNWPLPLSVTAWLAGAVILAVVGFFGRKK